MRKNLDMLAAGSNKTAIHAGEKSISYHLLYEQIGRFANRIKAAKGDRIVLFGENCPEWIYAFYACWDKQCIPVPVDHLSVAEDVAFILSDCKPSVVFCSSDKRAILLKSMKMAVCKAKIQILEEIATEENSSEKPVRISNDENDIAVIIYTSGTTGSPKGVMLSFANLKVNIDGVVHHVKIFNQNDQVLMLLPLHHILPLQGTLIMPLYIGATTVICPSLKPADILQTLQSNAITLLISVPRFYDALLKGIMDKIRSSLPARSLYALTKLIGSQKISRLLFYSVHKKFGGHIRYLVSGGATLTPSTAKGFMNLGFKVLEGYGMTEAAPMISFSRPGRYIPGYVGEALPGTNLEIREGEIVTCGLHVMPGYYARPGETSEVIRDGWLYTGDLGEIDHTGQIRITGRKKEILVMPNGKNINPEILEAKLLAFSSLVKEAGIFMDRDILQVIIVPDFRAMRNDGIENYSDYFKWEVVDKFNQSISSYYKILKVHLSPDELPKTRLGKIQRFQLKEIARHDRQELKKSVDEPEYTEYRIIRDYLKQETDQPVLPDDHFEMDLALDSLNKITLLVFLENTFGVKIAEEEFFKYSTIRELCDFIHREKIRSTVGKANWSVILKEKVHVKLPRSGFSITFFNTLSKIILRLYFRLRSEGISNIPEGPFIIAPNHQSFIDGFFVTSFLHRKIMRNTYVYAKEKYWRNKIMRYLAQKNNIILMDINKDLKLSLQKMAAILNKGRNLIIFPEGTRTRTGQLGQFRKTFAILSHELNIPVIPVVIQGSYEAMPAGRLIPRPFRKINIKFLQPVYPVNHSYNSLTQLVRNRVAMHLDE